MPLASALAVHLVDPRGRSSRRDFLLAAIGLFGLQLAFFALVWSLHGTIEGMTVLPANLAFCWMAFCAISRRLHDLGRSAWLMPLAASAWIAAGLAVALAIALVAGPRAVRPGSAGFWITFAILLVPPLVTALWLHTAEGQGESNRYGPPSDDGPDGALTA